MAIIIYLISSLVWRGSKPVFGVEKDAIDISIMVSCGSSNDNI